MLTKKYQKIIIKSFFFFLSAAIFVNIARASFFSKSKNPPLQPTLGPGGADYKYESVVTNLFEAGTEHEYWMMEPAGSQRDSLPVVVFNHGWIAEKPIFYKAWIDHIVKKGNLVIYPQYQENLTSPSSDFTPNAIGAVKLALERLKVGRRKIDLSKFAILGHSEGAIISANMAALAKEEGLPQPKAVMCVQPAASWINTKLEDMSKIPQGTLLLALASDRDNIAFKIDAKKIFTEAINIPSEDKNLIIMPSDTYGLPKLIADHFAPCGTKDWVKMKDKWWSNVDALDYYGFWKLFDGLRDAAFLQKNREYALGNTSEQKFMGVWSDGQKVKELEIEDQNKQEAKAFPKNSDSEPKAFTKLKNLFNSRKK